MKRITQPLFLPIIKGSLLGIAWLVDTFHQKNSRNLLVNFQNFLLCSYHLHINPSQDQPNLPRPTTNRTKKHIHHLKMYRMYVLLKNGYVPTFSPGCIHQLTREFLGWIPPGLHTSMSSKFNTLVGSKASTSDVNKNWDQPGKTHRTNPTSMVCLFFKLFLYCVYIYEYVPIIRYYSFNMYKKILCCMVAINSISHRFM